MKPYLPIHNQPAEPPSLILPAFLFGILLVLIDMLCAEMAIPAAQAAKERVIYVAVGAKDGNGLSPGRPLGKITDALKMAERGDTIQIAPGEYVETLAPGQADLRIFGSFDKENMPLVTISAPPEAESPLITDKHNTIWRGLRFTGTTTPLLKLDAFNGRFEHCRFEMNGPDSAIHINGGNPVFTSCTVAGHPGPTTALKFGSHNPKLSGFMNYGVQASKDKRERTVFAYCLFQNMAGGVAFLRGDQALEFTNCVFANHNYILVRPERNKSDVRINNSVFYLGQTPGLIWQPQGAPTVLLENCLYAPGPGPLFNWQAKALEDQPELKLKNCLTASPRFAGGRRALINLGVDDTGNAEQWNILADRAGQLGLKITLSVNADTLNHQYWDLIVPQVAKGHEIAAHGAAHAALSVKEAVNVSHHTPENTSAMIFIDKNKNFRVDVDGKTVFGINLAQNGLKLEDLVRRLQEAGFKARLLDPSYKYTPARLLAEASGQNIFFEDHAPALVLDTGAYVRYMLDESRMQIEQGLKARLVDTPVCTALVYPYSEGGPTTARAAKGNSFEIVRGRRGNHPFLSALEEVNLYDFRGAPLKNLITAIPTSDKKEMLRLVMDFLKYHGAIISLYSHYPSEFDMDDWNALLEVVAEDQYIREDRLMDIARQVKLHCASKGQALYKCPENSGPVAGKPSFIPGAGSPLLSAGKPTPFRQNFYGHPVGTVNIGLY